ncbi:MAG: aminotransferase DegT [Epsilonproteobacteria bacterium]|nr:aminotransferase DegT [Campylobacterota bacterium]NPA89450.1 aminotransferase class I/II-fold pyridoxal phosphate-dependent enzyme [Campylobacterota bacterium]
MIFLSPPDMSGNEFKYLKEAFESNYIAPVGEFLNRFEEMIREYTGVKEAVAVSSGTAGLHLALRGVGVERGDKVLVSDFTFIGSVNPILYQGGEPIFIDSDPTHWHIDLNLLEEALKKEKPKAVVIAHIYGEMAPIGEILSLCEKYGVPLVEDSAEALGAFANGKSSGTFGEVGVFSFNGNKILTTSGGGVVVTDNRKLAQKFRKWATQAREEGVPWYCHREMGYNYRLSNLLAAIGVGQMEQIEEKVAKRRQIFERYKKIIGEKIPEVEFMPELPGVRGSRWLTTLLLPQGSEPVELINFLKKHQIESRPLWKPMGTQPLFRGAKVYTRGVGEELFRRGVALPSGSSLTSTQLERVANLVVEFLQRGQGRDGEE